MPEAEKIFSKRIVDLVSNTEVSRKKLIIIYSGKESGAAMADTIVALFQLPASDSVMRESIE